jgi:hypothetical protein
MRKPSTVQFRLPVALAVILLGCAAPAFPIAIQNTTAPGYVDSTNQFSGVVRITFNGGYYCSGVLLPDRVDILTAGHCVSGASGWDVYFQTSAGNSAAIPVTQAFLDPSYHFLDAPYSGIPDFDVGVLRLATPAPVQALSYSLATGFDGITLRSTTLDLVGYGLGGSPATGFNTSITRRHAVNTIYQWICGFGGTTCDNTPYPTPDYPIELALTFTTNSAFDGYGLPNGGDSGGPLLFGNTIVGIASTSNLPRPGQTGNPQYTDNTTYYATYSDVPELAAWIDSVLVPEPSTWALLGLGCTGLFLRKCATARAGTLPRL